MQADDQEDLQQAAKAKAKDEVAPLAGRIITIIIISSPTAAPVGISADPQNHAVARGKPYFGHIKPLQASPRPPPLGATSFRSTELDTVTLGSTLVRKRNRKQ